MNDCTVTALPTKGRRPKGGPRPPALRSAVTNGTKLFVDGAHEGPWARRFRDLVQLHEEDLGPRESLSEAQRSLCRRVATIEVTLEQWEGQLSKGEDVDLGAYREMTGQLTRTLNALGLNPVVVAGASAESTPTPAPTTDPAERARKLANNTLPAGEMTSEEREAFSKAHGGGLWNALKRMVGLGGGNSGPDASLPQGPVPGASGYGLTNAYWRGPLDGKGEGGQLGPREMFSYLKSIGATDNEATMLTGAASSESSFNPNAKHDPKNGVFTGHGLFGHNDERLDMRGKNWQEQSALALNELRHRSIKGIGNLGDMLSRARTPEEITDVQMHYEAPRGYKTNNPRAGDNYMGRLNSIRRFSAMRSDAAQSAPAPQVPTAPIGDQAALDAQNRIAAGKARAGDAALIAEHRKQQNTPAPKPALPPASHPDDDRASRARKEYDGPYSAPGHLSPVQFTKGGGSNPLSDLHKEGWLGAPLNTAGHKLADAMNAQAAEHHRMARHIADLAKGGKLDLAHILRHHGPLGVSSSMHAAINGGHTHNERHGDHFHIHGTDAKSGIDHAVRVSARRGGQDRIRFGQASQQ